MFVRKLEKEDWQAYKALRLEALRLHPDVYGSNYESAVARGDQEWQDFLTAEGTAFFGLYNNDSIIGSAGVCPDPEHPPGYSVMFIGGYIKSAYRGRGLSHFLYQARLDWVKQQNRYALITIGHKKGNEAVARASKSLGFECIGEEEHVFGDGMPAVKVKYVLRLK